MKLGIALSLSLVALDADFGSGASTEAGDTCAGTGAEIFTGSGASTEDGDTCAGAGTNAIPGEILASWWRADQGTTIATGVSQWNDLSGNAHHQLQATGTKQPTLSANGGPNSQACIIADGSNDVMKASWTQNQPISIYIVCKWNNAFAAAGQTMFDGGAGTGSRGRLFRLTATSLQLEDAGPISGTVNTPTNWHYYRIDLAGNVGTVYQDGVQKFTGAETGNTGGMNIFTYADGVSDPCPGSIAEIIYLNAVPSAANDAAINAYIQSRYSL